LERKDGEFPNTTMKADKLTSVVKDALNLHLVVEQNVHNAKGL
jgi:hypothetical protein